MFLPERRRTAVASPKAAGAIEKTSAPDVPDDYARDAVASGPAAGPQDGDIVVTRESISPLRLTVSQVPAAVQVSASSREEAVRLAQGFARKHRVDVWYGEGGAVGLLKVYRRKQAPAR